MMINEYRLVLDKDGKNKLEKEKSGFWPDIYKMDAPHKVAYMINEVYKANEAPEEYVWLIATDTAFRIIATFEVAHGGPKTCDVTPREIFTRACLCGASGIILVHNHPGGESEASKADDEITERISTCGAMLGIPLVDHVIVCGDEYYSYMQEQKIH